MGRVCGQSCLFDDICIALDGDSGVVSASMCYLQVYGFWVVELKMARGTFCFPQLCPNVHQVERGSDWSA